MDSSQNFLQRLGAQGYAAVTIQEYRTIAGRLCEAIEKRALPIGDLDGATTERLSFSPSGRRLCRYLPEWRNGRRIIPVRRAVTMLLLGMLLVQSGPGCWYASAVATDSMQCCQRKCPARFSQMPANCCWISASSDKAKPSIAAAPQPALACTVSHLAPVAVQRISYLSLVTYSSAAPPPQRVRLDLLCSRQI